jgi:integrase
LSAAAVIDENEALLFRPADLEALIACAALLCLRQGELGGLRWSDVDFGAPLVVLVARQWAGSALKMNARPQRIEAAEWLRAPLIRHRDRLVNVGLYLPGGPVFPVPASYRDKNGPRAYTRGQALTSLRLRSAVNRAGLPHAGAWTAHSLRDSFVTLEVGASGGDLARVASRSRHKSLSSFVRYVRALTRDAAPPAFGHLPGPTNASDAAPQLPSHADPSSHKEPPS